MDREFVQMMLRAHWREHGSTWEEAARVSIRNMPQARSMIEAELESILEEARANRVLDRPYGVADPAREVIEEGLRDSDWYPGPQPGDVHWPAYEGRLLSGPMRDVVEDVDGQSTKIVAHLSDPRVRKLRKKGLVIGFVQSGKTANYTAVMAKAADAGYRLFIVMAGMHNGLRRQTQQRLERDLMNDQWKPLTTLDADFGVVTDDRALLKAEGLRLIAVIKKNPHRLRRLRDWLRDIPEDIRKACPTLLLDDESDQATPNTMAARNELSTINRLVREVRAELPTGTYLGYTATPFANVFMDPDDEEELYPSDFIIDLPRPDNYFGAERLFGRDPINAEDSPDDGLDMVRDVHDDEAGAVQPPSNSEDRLTWVAPLVPSMRDAVEWFLLATATRWARGQEDQHSSMLLHTTHYVDAHFAQQATIDELLDSLRNEVTHGTPVRLKVLWAKESKRVRSQVLDEVEVTWESVSAHYPRVLEAVRTIVDNGSSDTRLRYGDEDADGKPIIETVIAIGGNTLSRGLTLEGLIVSYFVRASNTYDTLLQMARWFGYRTGYSDLPRIWVTEQLAADFRFLATVEEEIRQDMVRYERERITPRQFGLRVRQHPGRLAITARAKMAHARPVAVSFGGARRQSFIMHEFDSEVLRRNLDATSALSARCLADGLPHPDPDKKVFYDLPLDAITRFLSAYRFHEDHADLHGDAVLQWLEKRAAAGRESSWNVAFMSSTRQAELSGGQAVDLGEVQLAVGTLSNFNRAPLIRPGPGTANLKTLMSRRDRLFDLGLERGELAVLKKESDFTEKRRELDPDRGLLLVYPVSSRSVPMKFVDGRSSRRAMEAPEHLIGVGLVFPFEPPEEDQTYVSVSPDWQPEPPVEAVAPLPADEEGTAEIHGGELLEAGLQP